MLSQSYSCTQVHSPAIDWRPKLRENRILRRPGYDRFLPGLTIVKQVFTRRFTIQSGLRLDHHNQYKNFFLPRISLMYRFTGSLTSRLGGGLGYNVPTLFSSDIDERDYGHLLPLANVKEERSAGVNWDINYHQRLDIWNIVVNQTFYITQIKSPLVQVKGAGDVYFRTADSVVRTSGFETYVQLERGSLEIYLGYVYTVAKKLYDPQQSYLSLSARNKFASVLAYEFTDNFRAGLEAAYTGRQYLDDGRRTPGYPFVAGMLRYDWGPCSFVLNCENLFDYRQTRKESIVSGPPQNPVFAQLWAPIDGRAVNLSARIRLR